MVIGSGLALSVAWGQPAPTPRPAIEPAPPVAPAKFEAPVKPTRADVARAYLGLEHALNPSSIERPADVPAAYSKAFDALTMSFFGGRFDEVIKQVHTLTDTVHGRRSLVSCSPDVIARSLHLSCDPPVIALNAFATAKVTLTSMYDAGAGAGLAAPIKRTIFVKFEKSNGSETTLQTEATIVPAGMLTAELLLDLPKDFAGATPGVYDVSVLWSLSSKCGGHGVGRIVLTAQAPSADRAAITERAQALEASNADEHPPLAAAARRVLGRATLLTDSPSPNNSSEFMLDIPGHVTELNAELDQIAAGNDPFSSRRGDWWTLLKTNASTNPTRIIAPASALTPGVKPPLLIALHGMGGDENMFPDAYGNGRLKALADKHAFILVSPRVDLTTFTSPKAVDAFLDDLASMYEFDRDRVYVIGHSMGAGAAAYIARNSITKVAAVACLAGGPQRPVLRSVAPMLVFGAELDPIISAATLEAAARASEAAGFSVEYREAADHGHTLMVGPVLDEVVIWLLQRRLDVAERQRWLDEDKARAKKPAPSKPAPAPATPANSLADPQSTAPASTPPAAP